MNVERLVRESIDRGVDSLPKSAPDLERIRGRKHAGLRIAVPALAAAVVATGFVLLANRLDDGSDKAAPANLPDRHSTAYISYSENRQFLHWGDDALPVKHVGWNSSMQAMTSAGLVYLGADGTPYLLDKSGDSTPLGEPVDDPYVGAATTQVVSDTAGDYAAWAHYDHGRVTINRLDAATRKVTTSPTFDCAEIAPGCDFVTAHVLDHGVVYATAEVDGGSANDSTIAWDPSRPAGERIYPLTDPGTSLAAASENHLVLAGDGPAYGGPDRAPLPASTKVSRLGEDEARTATVTQMSPDGRWRIVDPQLFMEAGGDKVGPVRVALNVDTGRTVAVDVSGDIEDATFDEDGSLLLIVNTGRDTRMDDCAIPSGACRTIIKHLEGTETTFPDGGIV